MALSLHLSAFSTRKASSLSQTVASLKLSPLMLKVSEIADRILKSVKAPFRLDEASARLQMVCEEETLLKSSLEADLPSKESISKACSYVKTPLEFLLASRAILPPKTEFSLPRNTRRFIEKELNEVPIETKKELGKGVYATVDLVKSGNEYFAAKNLSSQDRRVIDAFQREASFLMILNHPNIIRAEAILPNKILLEHATEGSLDKVLQSPTLTAELVQSYILDIVEGLDHVHRNGFTHKDIKTQNVLISEGRAKLSDFGLTALTASDRNKSGAPYYVAPELHYHNSNPSAIPVFSKQVDIWSLGALIFNVITGGKNPFPRLLDETAEKYCIRISELTLNKPCNEELLFSPINGNIEAKKLMEDRDPKKILRTLLVRCLNGIPEKRPSLDEIKKILTPSEITQALLKKAAKKEEICTVS